MHRREVLQYAVQLRKTHTPVQDEEFEYTRKNETLVSNNSNNNNNNDTVLS